MVTIFFCKICQYGRLFEYGRLFGTQEYMEMSFQKKNSVSPNGKGANFTQTLNVQ